MKMTMLKYEKHPLRHSKVREHMDMVDNINQCSTKTKDTVVLHHLQDMFLLLIATLDIHLRYS